MPGPDTRLTSDQLGRLLDDLVRAVQPGPPGIGYALPEATLQLITRVIQEAGMRNVFEFGSGQSTRAFLAAGCALTTVEDSRAWLDRTLATLEPEERSRLEAVCQPLEFLFYQGAPFRGWRLAPGVRDRLAAADLVLIDSPAFPPFREHALGISLQHCAHALIVVDDAAIPTVRRFCDRFSRSPGTMHRHVQLDHGLFFIARAPAAAPTPRRGLVETAKAWRRFFMARSAARHYEGVLSKSEPGCERTD